MFMTINRFSVKYGIANGFLRRLLKEGQLPGYYSGTRFYINCEALLKRLQESQPAARDEVVHE